MLNGTYAPEKFVRASKGALMANMHEFTLLKGGKSALIFTHAGRLYESQKPKFEGWVLDLGFIEIDTASGQTLFEWWSLDHVHPLQSTVDEPKGRTEFFKAWDYFHINAIDKNDDGDYEADSKSTVYQINDCSSLLSVQFRNGDGSAGANIQGEFQPIVWGQHAVNSLVVQGRGYAKMDTTILISCDSQTSTAKIPTIFLDALSLTLV